MEELNRNGNLALGPFNIQYPTGGFLPRRARGHTIRLSCYLSEWRLSPNIFYQGPHVSSRYVPDRVYSSINGNPLTLSKKVALLMTVKSRFRKHKPC
jgi:hypothetical protein